MFLIVFVFLVLLFSNSLQTCVPGDCLSSIDTIPTLKDSAPHRFRVGYISMCGEESYASHASWVFYTYNMNSTFLPDVKMELYYQTVCSVSSIVVATNEQVQTHKVQAMILQLPENPTFTSASIATAYGVSVISTTSMTELFDDKRAFNNLFSRLATPTSHQTAAILQTLTHLGIDEIMYIYTDDVYGSQNSLVFIRTANLRGISVNTLALQAARMPTQPPQMVVDARAIIFDTNPSEGIPFLDLLVAHGVYGVSYFYMFSLDMARALAPIASYYPMGDGSFILVPIRITVTPYSEFYSNGWHGSDSDVFPGTKEGTYWSTTIDAATIIASSVESLVSDGYSADDVNGTMLHQRMLNICHPSYSGEFRFNADADRDLNFALYNIIFGKNGTYNTSLVGMYNTTEASLLFYPTPVLYFNHSSVLPVNVKRFSDMCSFRLCHFRGNCTSDAKCVCDPGFVGPYCENMVEGFGSRTIVAWAVPLCIVVLGFVVGMFLFQKRRKATLLKGIAEKQRSEIPRNDIKLLERIGRGASGQVSKAMFRGTEVAVKRLVTTSSSKDAVDEFMLEAAIMCGLRHPNIVLFMGSSFDPIMKEMLLVMEYMARGSVHDVIHNPKICMPYELKLHLALQAAQGMNFLHSSKPPVIHRDLKSHNILLDDKWNARISDFGITRIQEINKAEGGAGIRKRKVAPQCLGTIFWTAPEVLNGNNHTESSDCYSFGIVLWEIFHRAGPYMGVDTMVIAVEVPSKGRRPEISETCPPEIRELMKSCWHQDPGKRPSFQEIVNSLRAASVQHPLHNIDSQTSNPRGEAPSGLVYVVNTDIPAIFNLWESAPRATLEALKLHNQIVRTSLEAYGGYEISFSGASFLLVFPSLNATLDWSINLQASLLHAPWHKQILAVPAAEQIKTETGQLAFSGPRVRIAVHSGVIQPGKDHMTGRATYIGAVVDRVKAMLEAIPMGDIVVSATVHDEIMEKQVLQGFLNIERVSGLDDMVYYMLVHTSLAHRKPPGTDGASLMALPNLVHEEKTRNAPKNPKWLIQWKDLSVKEPLGTGTVGDFNRAIFSGHEVAVKCLINQKLHEHDILELTCNAVILSKISHPNLLPFYGVCLENQNVAIVTDYVSRGNLRELLSDENIPITLSRRLKMAKEIAAGLTYLSCYPDVGVRIHDNFKSHNIMVTRDWTIKIADFGQSSVKDLCRTMTSVSNVAWTAPEVLEGEPLNNNSGLYTFGIIMWELFTRKIPYQTEHPIRIINKILGGHRPPVPKDIPQQYKDLMESCWHPFGNMRPSWHVIQSELSFILDGLPQ